MSQDSTICCVGSANLEQIISIQRSLELGAKNDVTEQKKSAGGSALNHSCRLLSMGFRVVPILPIGDDDPGKEVVKVLEASRAKGDGRIELNLDDLVQKGESTSSSVIVIDPLGRRTIFNWAGTASGNLAEQLDSYRARLEPRPDAVIIGHISADKSGYITRDIINEFSKEGAYILVNLGRTQYEQGPGAFLDVLKRVHCIQFELAEAKEFVLSEFRGESPSLESVLRWLVDRTGSRSVVLTLAEAGAVACHRDDDEKVIIAWPYDLEGIIRDSTGAGDAFSAGLVSVMAGSDGGINQFENALAVARDWAAYACTTLGGAKDCPNQYELQEGFVELYRDRVLRAPERWSWHEARHILRYFDIARRYSMFGFASSA